MWYVILKGGRRGYNWTAHLPRRHSYLTQIGSDFEACAKSASHFSNGHRDCGLVLIQECPSAINTFPLVTRLHYFTIA